MARPRDTGRGSGVKFELSVRNTAATIANLYAKDRYLKSQVQKEVRASARAVHALTYFLCPVDTGFMREHIRTYVSKEALAFEVGWDASDFFGAGFAFYPFFQEYGTVKMAAQPSLTPAYEHERPLFEAAIRRALIRAVARRQANAK
jgi:HK97 gp10 family phage protein